jgi:hypothetical protein
MLEDVDCTAPIAPEWTRAGGWRGELPEVANEEPARL